MTSVETTYETVDAENGITMTANRTVMTDVPVDVTYVVETKIDQVVTTSTDVSIEKEVTVVQTALTDTVTDNN
jgi:hypothetical protein